MKLIEPIRDWWNDNTEVRRDPAEAAQQLLVPAKSVEEVYARQGMVPPEAKVEPTVEEPKVEEPMVKPEEPTIYPRLEKAKELYPYLKDKDFDYTEQLTDDEKAGFLEFWEPGDEGPPDGSVKRPESIGLDRMGIEVRNDKTRPIDILGDYVSHEAVKSDPKLKDIYDRYLSTLTDEQLRTKYEYEKKNYGENRPFEQWAERSGKPGMFRGYTFNQFSEKEIEEAYTPEQLDILDEAKEYLNIDINRVKTKGLDKEESIQSKEITPQPKEEVLPEVQEPIIKEETIKEEPVSKYTEKDLQERELALVNDVYDMLEEFEGKFGDNTGAADTVDRGLTRKEWQRQKDRANNQNMTPQEASIAFIKENYVKFYNELPGFKDLDWSLQRDILNESYNLGMNDLVNPKKYPKFMKAVNNQDPEQIFFNLLDTANTGGKSSKGIAVRRAKLYNKWADSQIKTVEQLKDGTIIYSTEEGELFRYRKPKADRSDPGKVKL